MFAVGAQDWERPDGNFGKLGGITISYGYYGDELLYDNYVEHGATSAFGFLR